MDKKKVKQNQQNSWIESHEHDLHSDKKRLGQATDDTTKEKECMNIIYYCIFHSFIFDSFNTLQANVQGLYRSKENVWKSVWH